MIGFGKQLTVFS